MIEVYNWHTPTSNGTLTIDRGSGDAWWCIKESQFAVPRTLHWSVNRADERLRRYAFDTLTGRDMQFVMEQVG